MADEMTLQAIADYSNVSREAIRQEINAILKKVKNRLELMQIFNYSDIGMVDAIVDGLRAGNRPRND